MCHEEINCLNNIINVLEVSYTKHFNSSLCLYNILIKKILYCNTLNNFFVTMQCHIKSWSHKILLRPCNNVCQRHFSKICIIVSIIGYWTLRWMIAIFIRPNINFVRKGRVLFPIGSTYCPIVSQNIKDMANFRVHLILHRWFRVAPEVEIFYF